MLSRSSFRVFAVAFAVMIVIPCAALSAKTAIIHLRDRPEPIKGEWIGETSTSVTVSIAGISRTIPRDNIRKIEWELAFPDEYRQRRAKIDNKDIVERYKLAHWAYSKNTDEADKLVLRELNGILQLQPDNQEASLLRKLVTQRIKSRAEEKKASNRPSNNTPSTQPNNADQPQQTGKPLKLTDDQCNIIKIFELDLNDRPRLSINRQTLGEFWDKYRADDALLSYQGKSGRNKFLNLSAVDQLEVMFQVKAREFYPKVVVRSEPQPLIDFRLKWNRALVTTNLMQHFGEQLEGSVHLVGAERPNSEVNAYTNFLALHRATYDGRKFIDRAQPRDSLLLQWALPRDEAKYPAPESARWKPYFNSLDDRRVRDFEEWVRSLYTPSPSYPIDFEPLAEPESAETADSDA